MRRIAAYGDIHANLPALEAVLAHIHSQGVTERYCLGDLVGYGPYPEETIALVRTLGDPVVQGNHDRAVGERLVGSSTRYETPEEILDGGESHGFTISAVGADDVAFLGALPREIRLEHEGLRILLCHASPRRLAEHIAPDAAPSRLAALARKAGVEVVVCGHSHLPFHRAMPANDGVRHWINVGAVGRQRDGDPRAAWAEIVLGTRDEVLARVPEDLGCRPVGRSETWLGVHIHRVPYDSAAVATATTTAGLPATLADGLRTGTEERMVMAPSSGIGYVRESAWRPSRRRVATQVDPEPTVTAWSPSATRAERMNALADRIAAYESLAAILDDRGNRVGDAVRRLRAAMRGCRTGSPMSETALTDAFQDADIALRTTAGHGAFESERERLYGPRGGFNPFRHVLSPSELTYMTGDVGDNARALRELYSAVGFTHAAAGERLCPGHISVEMRFMAHCLSLVINGRADGYEHAHRFFTSHLADWAVLFAVVTGQEAREPVMHYTGLALDKHLVCESAAFRLGLQEVLGTVP